MAVFGTVLLCLALFAGMAVLLEAGFRLGKRYERARGGEAAGIFDSAIFALLGLLLGFAFAGAVDRLNTRRDLIVQEANAIGTAYLRIDVLQPEDQPPIRALFAQSLEARLEAYRTLDAGIDPAAAFQKGEQLQAGIFAAAVSLTIYTILDLDNPRGGFIRLEAADRVLEDLTTSI